MRILRREASNTLNDCEVWVVRSALAGRDYRITVAGPGGPLPAGVRLPAVYGTDADLLGGANIVAARGNVIGGDQPPLFVVNVGYPAEEGPVAWMTNRLYEFSSKADPDLDRLAGAMTPGARTGGAAGFLAFLTEELKPLIEAEYPVAPGPAGLLGSSAGGYFVLYALARAHAHFNRVLCLNPALFYIDESFKAAFAEFVSGSEAAEIRLFTGAGSLERREDWRRIVDQMPEPTRGLTSALFDHVGWPDLLQNALDAAEMFGRRPGVKTRSQIFENEHHGSAYLPALTQGLRWLYGPG